MAKKDITFTESKQAMKREASQHDYQHHDCPKVMTGEDYANRTIYARRAREFQGFSNPMSMTSFEQQEVNKEKQARVDARQNYIRGIQGRDGGNRVDNYERTFQDGPETN
jgi:hypothetical protein